PGGVDIAAMVSFSCRLSGAARRTPATTSTAAATGSAALGTALRPRTSVAAAIVRMGKRGKIRDRRHARWIDHDSALQAGACAFAANLVLVAQRDVNDAPFAAVHGIETEHRPGAFHLIRRGKRADPQLLNAQRPIIVGVEGDARV